MRSISSAGLGALLIAGTAAAAPITYSSLQFETAGQSLWDSGEAYILDESTFIGAQWSGLNVSAGDIAGDIVQVTPAIPATYSPHIPAVYSPAVPSVLITPAIPSVCVFGVCTPRVPAVYSPYIPPQLITPAIPSVQLTPYIPATYLDTRTGLEISGSSSGRVGFELGMQIDSGSVDATVSFDATIDVPDITNAAVGQFVSLNASSAYAGINTLATNFPELTLTADAVMQLSGSINATGCFIGAGCGSAGTSYNINEIVPVVSLEEGEVRLFGQTPSDLGLPPAADGFPVSFDVAGLADITVHLPQPDSLGGLNPDTGTLTSTGQDDLLDLILDVDNIVATAAGVPGLLGSSIDVAGIGEVGYDIINVFMGPTIDLRQDFELTPTLWVDLAFDQIVQIGTEFVTDWSSPWSALPDIAFLSELTTVIPTFSVQALLLNETLLDFDLEFGIDLLQIYYDFGLLGEDTFGIGNVLSQGVDLFTSPAFYDEEFALGGFNLIVGEQFVVDLRSGAPPPTSVPEPSPLLLMLLGICGILLARRFGRGRTLQRSPS